MEGIEKAFMNRGILRAGILMLDPLIAIELVDKAREAQVQILGLDAFVLSEDSTQPVLEHSIDFIIDRRGRHPEPVNSMDCWQEAREFLKARKNSKLMFEVVLDGEP